MSHFPAAKPRQVLRVLQKSGFVIHHASGSHYILKHPAKPLLRVTLPFHSPDLKRRTLDSILKQAGLSRDQFRELL